MQSVGCGHQASLMGADWFWEPTFRGEGPQRSSYVILAKVLILPVSLSLFVDGKNSPFFYWKSLQGENQTPKDLSPFLCCCYGVTPRISQEELASTGPD